MEPVSARYADAPAELSRSSRLNSGRLPHQLIVLGNRQPFRHDYDRDGQIVVTHSHSGVVHAVEPLISAYSGVWVGHGGGTADRAVVDQSDGLNVPANEPAYRLRRVWLEEAEERGYYDGFANEALWPLCHRAYVKPTFRSSDFLMYEAVNARFAGAVCEEATGAAPLVLVQDYHFALAPRLILNRLPGSVIVTFWHIPWPHWQDFEVCPWGSRLLHGLLGSGIVGFQTPDDCRRFLETVERTLGAPVDFKQQVIAYCGRRVLVRDYAASIEWPSPWAGRVGSIESCRREVLEVLQLPSGVRLGVGVDRMDYTKGLEDKFLAIERLLERAPELQGRFTFVQMAQPTRARLAAYTELRTRLLSEVERINKRFSAAGVRPIVLIEGDHHPSEVFRYLRAADFCYVGSLHDGMNLVSKEFVSAREDEQGVLVLSRFAGAARALSDALIVNPLDLDEAADVLGRALRMSPEEQHERMCRMRSVICGADARAWAGRLLADAQRLAVHGPGRRQVVPDLRRVTRHRRLQAAMTTI